MNARIHNLDHLPCATQPFDALLLQCHPCEPLDNNDPTEQQTIKTKGTYSVDPNSFSFTFSNQLKVSNLSQRIYEDRISGRPLSSYPLTMDITPSIVQEQSIPISGCNNDYEVDFYRHKWDSDKRKSGRINKIRELCHVVMCRGCCNPASINHKGEWIPFGYKGHIESFSAWSHLIAAVAALVYATFRSASFDISTAPVAWTVAAAWSHVLTFSSSVLYHATSPDKDISALTRQLDFGSIYISLALISTADMCVFTKNFTNVPLISLLDVPLAVGLTAGFFIYRRFRLDFDSTFDVDRSYGSCTLTRWWHKDGEHGSLRVTTSFTITLFPFTLTPCVINNYGSDGVSIIILQAFAFLVVVFGMTVDHVIRLPDRSLALYKDKSCLSFLTFPKLGCMIDHHGFWHICAIVAVAAQLYARELALVMLDY